MHGLKDSLKQLQDVCADGRSQVFPYGSHGYLSGVRHYFDSSSEFAHAVVEPGTAEELAEIMKVIADNCVPFAIKGGGHTSNPHFSSTTGIQISMTRLNKVEYNETEETVEVGAGCLFSEIYDYLLPRGRNIVGGASIPGVGVAGWLLGGGYSLKTNQYGLGIDHVTEIQIVLPKGGKDAILTVTDKSDGNLGDLFWAIRGGGNNFGVVTKFTLKTHPQEIVYGGVLSYGKERIERVKVAVQDFLRNEKRKEAAIVVAFRHFYKHGQHEFKLTVQAFFDGLVYDDDNPFEGFLDIPHEGELEHTSYGVLDDDMFCVHGFGPLELETTDSGAPPLSYSMAAHVNGAAKARPLVTRPPMLLMGPLNARARWGNVMVSTYTRKLIDTVEEEAKAAKRLMQKHSGKMIVTEVWPFLQSIFEDSPPAAWPHKRGRANGPLLVYFLWEGEENDRVWIDQMKKALKSIRRVALEEQCTTQDAPVYINTTLEETTSVEEIYHHNLPKLSRVRRLYDPSDIMSNTGGFRIPLAPTGHVDDDYEANVGICYGVDQ